MPYVGAANVPGRGIDQLDTATNVAGPSAGLQAVLAYYKSKGVPADRVTPDMIRQAIAANARAPGDPEANGPNLGPTVLNLRNAGIEDASPMPARGGGNTSAAPTSTALPVPPIPPEQGGGGGGGGEGGGGGGEGGGTPPAGGSSLMQTLAPLLAGAGAASFPLGRMILDRMQGARIPGAAAPEVRLPTTGPGFDPEYGPRLPGQAPTGPGFSPEYGPTVRPPPVAPTGPGFSPEYGSGVAPPPAAPPTPASGAIDKAVADTPKPVRAKTPRARTPRVRIPPIK
jgi:hypothetical protein